MFECIKCTETQDVGPAGCICAVTNKSVMEWSMTPH